MQRFNLYVDCMPPSPLDHMPKDQFDRIAALAASRPRLKGVLGPRVIEKLSMECNTDMTRAMNKIQFVNEVSGTNGIEQVKGDSTNRLYRLNTIEISWGMNFFTCLKSLMSLSTGSVS
jgi:hypothetical protein